MSKKNKKHTRVPTPSRAGSTLKDWSGAEVEIQELIAAGHSKAAVEAAKELHKYQSTPASEGLLIRSYEARIGDLLRQGMLIEAKSLLNLVGQRFPSAVGRLEELSLELCMNEGKLAEFVAPLQDLNLAPAVRDKVETAIRERVFDLEALAQARTLAPNHSLRQAATVLSAAFSAVTSRPVEAAELLLPEVSHRSPLAPWKSLVNAIAAFYRNEDAICRKWLGAIPPGCVPARLVPAIEVMLGSPTTYVADSAAQKLIESTGGGCQVLHDRLVNLEAAFAGNRRKDIAKFGAATVSACQQFRPELVLKLRQYIMARCLLLGFREDELRAAVAGTIPASANLYRLTARAMESSGDQLDLLHALITWDEFRTAALKEKWFASNTTEDGVLWLHMAGLAADIPAELLRELGDSRHEKHWPGKKGDLTPAQLFSPEVLYEKACAADPHPESFQSWLAWAKRQPNPVAADRAAEAWRKARPRDVAPLLWLMESSEKRNAYQKSLNYLGQAERLDRLNPAVRRAKLRLLVASAVRHFRQRKPHLAAQEIREIEAVAGSDRNLLILTNALRTVCAALAQDGDRARESATALEALAGNPAAAHILQRAILEVSMLPATTLPHLPDLNSFEDGMMLKGLAAACGLGESVGIPISIPEQLENRMSATLGLPGLALDTAETLVLGEAAVRSHASSLAFALSAAGMAVGGAEPRFLFLRARALPLWASGRRYDCLCAALQLARRDRDTDLVARLLSALEEHRSNGYGADDFLDECGPDDYCLEPDEVATILEEERGTKDFPVLSSKSAHSMEFKHDFEDDFEDDLDENDSEDFEEFLANLPEDLARDLNKAVARGAGPEEILKYILFGNSGERPLEELTRFLPAELAREINKLAAGDLPWKEILEARNALADANWAKPELPSASEKKTSAKLADTAQQSLF